MLLLLADRQWFGKSVFRSAYNCRHGCIDTAIVNRVTHMMLGEKLPILLHKMTSSFRGESVVILQMTLYCIPKLRYKLWDHNVTP